MTDETIEFREGAGTDDDPIAEAVAAVEEMRSAQTAFQQEQTTAAEALRGELRGLADRLDALDVRTQRPGSGAGNGERPETRAFTSYLRRGETGAGVEMRALSLAGSGGGYLAPEQFIAEIIRNLVQFSPIRQYARILTISASEARMPKRTGTLTAAWVGETTDRAETAPTYGEVTLTPYEIACYSDISNALLEDSAFSLDAELAFDLAEEFGRIEGAAFVSGDGTGKPAGIFVDADVETVPSGAAATITSDSLIDLYHALPGFYAANAVWGMNRGTIAAVRKLKDADGAYLWTDTLAAGNPPTILGRPVVELPDAPDIAAGAEPILFGDLKQAYLIVDRVSLGVLRDPYSIATKGQTRFHARRRVGGAVVKPEAVKRLTIATS